MARYKEPTEGSLVEALAGRARSTPDALAYSVEGEAITCGALEGDVRRLAGGLAASGVGPRDRCAIALPTSLDSLRVLFAVQWLGATPVAINPALPPGLLVSRARRAGCALAIADHAAVTGLADVGLRALTPEDVAARPTPDPGEPRPGSLAFVQITSGTAGEPRAVKIEQAALREVCRGTADAMGLTRADVFAGWVPLHHDLGLVLFGFVPLFAGCPSHLIRPGLARLRDWLGLVERVRATVTAAPDFVYRLAARRIAPENLDLTSLRVAVDGGEAVRSTTIREFESRFGVRGVVRPSYGLAEATLGVSRLRPGEPLRTDASGHVGCGRPWSGTEVRIVDPGGAPLPPLTAGEILVRGPGLFDGYLDDDAATRTALRGGWLHTGDVGAVDGDGQLFVYGRGATLIRLGGAVIAPRQVEEPVDLLEGVRLSAAVGMTDPSFAGAEGLWVVVEPRQPLAGGEQAALRSLISKEVAQAIGMAPARVLLAPPRSIPRTTNGKIRHAELARQLQRGGPGTDPVGPAP